MTTLRSIHNGTQVAQSLAPMCNQVHKKLRQFCSKKRDQLNRAGIVMLAFVLDPRFNPNEAKRQLRFLIIGVTSYTRNQDKTLTINGVSPAISQAKAINTGFDASQASKQMTIGTLALRPVNAVIPQSPGPADSDGKVQNARRRCTFGDLSHASYWNLQLAFLFLTQTGQIAPAVFPIKAIAAMFAATNGALTDTTFLQKKKNLACEDRPPK